MSDGQSQTVESENNNSKVPSMFRALSNRNYQYFFIGQLISLIGTWMQTVAEAWLVYKLTGSTVLLGLVSFSGQIPVFFLASIGGAIADKYNRQKILVITQSLSMILSGTFAVLVLTGWIQVSHLFILAVLLGLVNAFDIPTRQSFIVDLVKREDLNNAIALNSSMFNGARIVGPAIAGILVAYIGEGWCFAANSISYIAVIIGLLAVKIQPHKREKPTGSTISNIVEGFRYVAQTSSIRSLLLLLGVVGLMGTPYSVLMPIFADKILHGGASGLGFLMGAAGVGALAGALTMAARKGLNGIGRWIAISTAGFGVSIVLFSFSRSFWLSALLLVPAGFSIMLQWSASTTLVQSMVPDKLRGRVMAVYSMIFMGMAPLGSMLAGTLAQSFTPPEIGAPITVAVGGTACVIGAIIFGLNLSSFRQNAREVIVGLNMSSGSPVDRAIADGRILTSFAPNKDFDEKELKAN